MKNLKRQLRLTILSLSTLCLWTSAYGQITPSGDANTNTASPTTNYGAKPLLDVESASQTTYIQFDLSSLPASYTSANITKGTLKLYVNAVTTAGSFNVDFVNGTWSEKTITANLSPALGATIVASVPLTSANVHDYIIIDITSAVQAWLSGTANDGIALVGNSPLNANFDSKENTATSHTAELDIVFAGGGTITGVTTASGSGLTGGGTSGTLNLALTNSCATNQVLQWNGSSWVCTAVGTGTITGVTAGTDLTGGGTSGNVTLSLNTAATNALYAQLAAANTFTGNQTVNGNLSATGVVTGSGFQIGSNLFAFGSYANSNAFLGFAGNSTMAGVANTATGYQAFNSNTTGTQNVAHGYLALYSNTAGSFNAASGYQALQANTTGNSNTASGHNALVSNTTGQENTASGESALYSNTTGSYNAANGRLALHSNTTGTGNTASGYQSLFSNTTGSSDNTAVGFQSLYDNASGSNNTAVGAYAGNTGGPNLGRGSLNTYLGYYTNSGNQDNLTNSTAIGANAQVTASNAMVLGSINGVNYATADTLVGIGITAPTYKLHIGTINNSLRVEGPPMGGSGMVSASFGGNGDVGIDAPGAVNGRFVVKDTTGYVGIGTASPANTLEVGSGRTTLADFWTTRSSRRWKTNIQTLYGALDKVEQLRGVSYDLKETGKHEVGVIAEEVGAVVPEIVSWEKNGKDAQGVDYSRLTALLIEATKEQQLLIRKQQRQIETQQTQMKAQQAQIARLASEVSTIQVSMKHGNNAGGAKVRAAQAQMARVHQ